MNVFMWSGPSSSMTYWGTPRSCSAQNSWRLVFQSSPAPSAAAAALGAGLDWKTSLQEFCAEHDLGVPTYLIEDEGPDHMKTFTAQVRVADRLHGHGVGRSKKEAEQQAAESAYGTLVDELPPAGA